MKRLLILTGPQGSGNHMWSKIFALHPDVLGWRALLDEYWIGHDREPFADCWRDPSLLRSYDWSQSDYYVTSISVPYMENGQATIPPIESFCQEARMAGIDVNIAICGRDRNILAMQEQRVRGSETLSQALMAYGSIVPAVFLSFELLYLYRRRYLQSVARAIDFPIHIDSKVIDTILETNSNAKYFQPITHHWLDDWARKTSQPWH